MFLTEHTEATGGKQTYSSLFSVNSVSSVRAAPNSGIVLVIVLGMLTVMVLLAVTFAVSMRTERLAAGNAADTVRARQLVQVGLARAMSQLASDLGANGLAGGTGGKAYPYWNATNSYFTNDPSGNPCWSTNVYLLAADRANEATNYVPRALWADATNADLTNPSHHWLPVDSLIFDGGVLVESNRMGRVAYLILNCSGLLDANYAGGAASGRQFGTNPAEIAIAHLGEFGSVGAALDFKTKRSTDIRYETVAELNALADINIKPVTNLFVYSRSLPGYWQANVNPAFNCVGTQVNLSGTAADLILRRTEITNAFTNIGFGPFEAGVLFSNLIDYVDADSTPSNFDYCIESVPMINEVVVSSKVTVANSGSATPGYKNYTITPAVYVECWYPFVSNSNGLFDINGSVTFSAAGILPAPVNVPFSASLGTFSSGGFPFKICCSPPPYGPYDVPQVNPVKLISSITLSIISNAIPVDQIAIPVVLTNENDGLANNTYITYASAECRDPRFNANPENPNYWQKRAGHSLSNINVWPGGLYPPGSDGDENMYVANRPLKSVAELGCLVYSTDPWKTVKLYGSDRRRVLDVFGFSTNVNDVLMTNTVYRGLVNCNTNAASNALAAVFAGMPIDQYPGGSFDTLGMTEAQSFVSKLFAGGICTNLSDVGRNLSSVDFTFPSGMNELQREAYFRNACGLLNLRQNVFTIIIEAQAASSGNIPRNPAKQRAVAIVWRDPYTGEMFVRHIKWLED